MKRSGKHRRILTKDEKIRLQCEGREMYEHDITTIRGEGIDEGIALGMSQGISQGQERVNQLNKRLLGDNRMDDLVRSMDNPAYQERLMREYGIL